MQSSSSMESPQKQRYRVLVLGGGIHGVGVAHDLVSRGWKDVLLLEKSSVGHGTSSRSTKLIHGGLRYLEHIRDFPLVAEGLRERQLLIKLAPDLVHPIPLVFPVMQEGGMPRFMIKAGLTLYDMLAGRQSIGRHFSLGESKVAQSIPGIEAEKFKHFYVFYDGQTDDLALVHRVSHSARSLGAQILEHNLAEKIEKTQDGFNVIVKGPSGETSVVSAKYIVNAMGPWAHQIYQRSNIEPLFDGVNNKGAHIVIDDTGLKMGVFLQSPEDKRIFFVLPWLGKTLIGTTETPYDQDPDQLVTSESDVDYLIDRYNRYFKAKISARDVVSKFSGLRWLAKDKFSSLTNTSRSHVISEHRMGAGVIYTIYGGKLTAYRALSEEVGDRILKHYGDDTASRTHESGMWFKEYSGPDLNLTKRFIGM